MSHQTGIKPSQDLVAVFIQANDGAIRAIKVEIHEETLIPRGSKDAQGSVEEDFALLQDWCEDKSPCYILYRLDEKLPSDDFAWMLINYIPDAARVRDKMIQAATASTLQKELGDAKFVDYLHATSSREVSCEGYAAHTRHKNAAAPLTQKEEERQAYAMTETGADIGTATRKANAAGIGLPVSSQVEGELRRLKDGDVSTVVLEVSLNETIELLNSSDNAVTDLGSIVDSNKPCFVFSRYKYQFQSTSQTAFLFFYICPSASEVKSRMMYSSSRASVIDFFEQVIQAPLSKKVSIRHFYLAE
ncbi:Twinfilin-1 [Irineochytrium annulatum]|nr:Twinfilin-1 [Irineochytrium annulatum]